VIVDCHQHFWDLDKVEYSWLVPAYGPIYRTFTPAELVPQLQASGVDSTVLVQSANSYADTDAMLAQATQHAWIGAVTGWVPLEDAAETARKLDEEYLLHPAFKGVRHLNHDEKDPDWLARRTVLSGLKELQARKLVYEVVAVWPLHLGHVPALAAALPDLTIIVDHLAKPPIASGDLGTWKDSLRAAAAHPNVLAKVSGLNTTTADFQGWSGDDLAEAIGFAIEVFGVDRLMVGSDWPVAILAGDYAKVWTETRRVFERLGLSPVERAAIEGGTAARVYGIGGAA
jgi:L-fuconolactonase